jgi:hypothetical protein
MVRALEAVLLPSGGRWFMVREISIVGLGVAKSVF